MLTDYIHAAMHRAVYELLPNSEGFYGSIPGLEGVWATATTLEACREELQSTLEEWIILGLRLGHPIPVLEEIDLSRPVATEAA